jgi:hypothetical protein
MELISEITELLGGRIEVKSELGHGSVFRFFIQTRTTAAPSALAAYMESTSAPELIHTHSMTSSTSTSSTTSSSTSATTVEGGLHILIVEGGSWTAWS